MRSPRSWRSVGQAVDAAHLGVDWFGLCSGGGDGDVLRVSLLGLTNAV
ncbi:MAG: hypothetical protein IPL39_14360 [Opitutaceae bacterium]|nr:hypothetical protein [Opitutaceae bacterium]